MSEYIYDTSRVETHPEQGFTGEEIVRCRDCKHLNIVGKCPCGFWALETLDGFCSWGERKSE